MLNKNRLMPPYSTALFDWACEKHEERTGIVHELVYAIEDCYDNDISKIIAKIISVSTYVSTVGFMSAS